MRRPAALLFAMALAATGSLAGCDSPTNNPNHPETANWVEVAGRDLNCKQTPIMAPFSPQAYDINGDRVPDWFIAMRCPSQPAPQPYQVEVFDGTKRDLRTAKPMAILTRSSGEQTELMVYLDEGCLFFAGPKVIIRGRMHRPGDGPSAAPVDGFQTRMYTKGKGFEANPDPKAAVWIPTDPAATGGLTCPKPEKVPQMDPVA